MENASKALLIAGGVLLAIIIITMFLSMYGQIKGMEEAKEEKIKLEQLHAFNAQYEAYDKHIMYGADVITLSNKVDEHNLNNPYEQITLVIPEYFSDSITELKNGGLNEKQIEDLLKLRFQCTLISYASTGKVSGITIETAQ